MLLQLLTQEQHQLLLQQQKQHRQHRVTNNEIWPSFLTNVKMGHFLVNHLSGNFGTILSRVRVCLSRTDLSVAL